MPKWTRWIESKCYNYLDRKGRYQHARGSLPDNALVKFDNDDIGHVVHSNSEESLVHCGNERDWYPNSSLQVESE